MGHDPGGASEGSEAIIGQHTPARQAEPQRFFVVPLLEADRNELKAVHQPPRSVPAVEELGAGRSIQHLQVQVGGLERRQMPVFVLEPLRKPGRPCLRRDIGAAAFFPQVVEYLGVEPCRLVLRPVRDDLHTVPERAVMRQFSMPRARRRKPPTRPTLRCARGSTSATRARRPASTRPLLQTRWPCAQDARCAER